MKGMGDAGWGWGMGDGEGGNQSRTNKDTKIQRYKETLQMTIRVGRRTKSIPLGNWISLQGAARNLVCMRL